VKVRPLGPDDVEPLRVLVDADRLPGQPACTPDMVWSALTGRSSVAAWWWRQLASMRAVGAEKASGELVGAGAVGRLAQGGARYLLWVHAHEDRDALDTVIWSLLRGARRTDPVFAFWFATELSVGLEGLPRNARRETHEALVARGFTGEDRWLYLRATGAGPDPAPVAPSERGAEYHRRGLAGDLRVEMTVAGEPVGEAELSVPAPGIGVVWWLEIEAEHRRRGYGRRLLRAARHVLAGAGAKETILFVDHDDPKHRNRRPAIELYETEGFTVVDHLWSYRRGDAPPEEPPGRG
jgi:ribosomal protein S18 acetylase RimI-like enzyme